MLLTPNFFDQENLLKKSLFVVSIFIALQFMLSGIVLNLIIRNWKNALKILIIYVLLICGNQYLENQKYDKHINKVGYLFYDGIKSWVTLWNEMKSRSGIFEKNWEKEYYYKYERKFDTITVRTWEEESFTFSIKNLIDAEFGSEEATIAVVQLKSDGIERFMFKCHHLFGSDNYLQNDFFKHVKDDLWFFNYYSGGNYSRAVGYHLIRIKSDFVKYLGPVCGYDYIDISNSDKEFYVNMVTDDLQKSCSEYVIEKFSVTVLEDTIKYPFPDGY
jgi:hypothetical protein